MSLLSKISFVLSGISILGFAVSRLILGAWIPFLWVMLALFVFFLIVPFFVDRKIFVEFFTMKTTKHGMNMGVMILLVLAALGLINFISARHYGTFDFSAAKVNTLSEQSSKLASSLDSDLKVLFFYKKGVQGNDENRKAFRDLIKKYQDYSQKIQLEFVEVNERPDLAKEYGVDKGSGVAFFDYKGRRNRIEKIEEQELTSALVKVTREKNKTIYFIEGHGENSLDEEREAEGLGSLKRMLENNRYTVKTHPLTTTPKIPADGDVVVIVGPKQEYQEVEISGLREYLKNGGSLFMALRSKEKTGLDRLAKEVGVELGNNYIFSLIEIPGIGSNVNPDLTLGSVFSSESLITKSFGKSEIVRFHYPQSLFKSSTTPPGINIVELVKTGNNSMAFNELKPTSQGEQKPYSIVNSIKGKFPGGGDSSKEFSMVIAGDPDFIGNALLLKNLNRDLFLNSIAQLVKEDNLISVTPKEPEITQMEMTSTKFAVFVFLFAIPLPLVLFGSSITLWVRRRNA